MSSQPTFDFAAAARSGRQRPIVVRAAAAAAVSPAPTIVAAGRVAVGPAPTIAPPVRPCPTVAPTTGDTAPPTTAAQSTIAPKAKAAPPLLDRSQAWWIAPPTSVELRASNLGSTAPPTSVELRLVAIEDKMCVIEAKLDQLLVLVQERFCC
jgi:hypothetical protein